MNIKSTVTSYRETNAEGFYSSLFLVEHRANGETKRYPTDIQVRASVCDVETAKSELVESWKNDIEHEKFVIDERTTPAFSGYVYRIEENGSGSGTSFIVGVMNRNEGTCYQASVMAFGRTGLTVAATRNVVGFLLKRIENAVAELAGE